MQEAGIGKVAGFNKNLVATYGILDHADGLMMVMELVVGGTLHHALGTTPVLSIEARAGYLLDVVNGLAALHRCRPFPIVHGDLKSMNVLLSADRTTAKVCDFGLAKAAVTMATSTGAPNGGAGGTVGFRAPET